MQTMSTKIPAPPVPRALTAVAALWRDRPTRLGLFGGVACFVALCTAFCAYVHVSHGGDYGGPLLHGNFFDTPPAEWAAGVRPTTSGYGWDGQFYYFASNDLRVTPEVARCTDGASYRYQRIGLPLLAKGASLALGRPRVTPFLYFLTQFAVVAAAFGLLTGYFAARGVPPAFALCWLLSGGMLLCLSHGLPDPTCDALLLASLLALSARRLGAFALASSLMCLGRETYVLVPLGVWLGTAAGLIRWPGRGRLAAVCLAALPGVALLGWTFYLAHRLGLPPLHASRALPWGQLIDYPLWGAWKCFREHWRAGNTAEVLTKLVSAATCAGVFALAARHAARWLPLLVALPFLLLLLSTGRIVWAGVEGHLKNALPFVVVGLLLLPRTPSALLRGLLALQLMLGLSYLTYAWGLQPRSDSAHLTAALPRPADAAPQPPPAAMLPERRSALRAELISTQANPAYKGFWRFCHREPTLVRLTVTNTSSATWKRQPVGGPFAMDLACRGVDAAGKVVLETHYPLPRDLGPGESVEMVYPIPVQRRNETLTLRFSVIEHNVAWFQDIDPAFGCEIPGVAFTWSGL